MSSRKLVRQLLVGALAVAAGTTAVAVPLLASAASTRYEAESATLSQATVAADHPGFTGTGFVDYTNVSGSYVEFSVTAAEAGTATLTLRYANGSTVNRPLSVSVNGAAAAASTDFPGTGGWSTWKTVDVTASLVAGTNTVRATASTANGGPNLDSLTVLDSVVTPPTTPPPTPDWSVRMIDSTMAEHSATSLSWSYPNGLYLYGQYLAYQRLPASDPNKASYLAYIRAWADHYIDANGHISNSFGSLDSMQPGVVYLALYQATGQAKYRNAATQIETRLEHSNYPRVDGALQHATASSRAHQLWADGTFMALPFLARYENQIGDKGVARADAINNLITYAKHLQRPDGLLWHAYDASATQSWVVPGTNHSPESWCRAVGWFGMASVMVLDATPASTPGRPTVLANLQKLGAAIRNYQDPKTGRWFQVIDKGSKSDNWTETSCSSMFTYTISRSVEQGYLDASYRQVAAKGYLGPNLDAKGGVLAKISLGSNGHTQLTDICIGTNVGNYAFYIARPRATNDFHGLGSFLIMNEHLRRSTAS
jgi:unsaturated rhamnogalacturonyl hydrolase